MFATIFTALGGIKTVLIGLAGAVAIAGALYVVHVIKEEGALKSQLDEAVATNKANLDAFAQYKDSQAKALQALADQHQADVARLANASKLKQEIARAPKTDDGQVAPVLARTLDALRVRNGQAANPSPN